MPFAAKLDGAERKLGVVGLVGVGVVFGAGQFDSGLKGLLPKAWGMLLLMHLLCEVLIRLAYGLACLVLVMVLVRLPPRCPCLWVSRTCRDMTELTRTELLTMIGCVHVPLLPRSTKVLGLFTWLAVIMVLFRWKLTLRRSLVVRF